MSTKTKVKKEEKDIKNKATCSLLKQKDEIKNEQIQNIPFNAIE